MKFDENLVNDLADKLLIGLTEEENKMVLEEFEIIDKNIDLINQIPNIGEVEPMFFPFVMSIDELEEDIPVDSIPATEAFSNCESMENGSVKVPRVISNV